MAVAGAQSNTSPSRSSEGMGLIGMSLLGAVFVGVFFAFVLRGVPWLWEQAANSLGLQDSFVRMLVQVGLQLAAAIGLLVVSSRYGTGRHASGVRGGIFLMLTVALVALFSTNSLYHISGRVSKDGFGFGAVLAMLFHVVILFLIVQMFRTGRFSKWSLTLDQSGWFDTHTHKRTQGLRVRRLTILGLLLVSGTGIWTLSEHNYLPQNNQVKVPVFTTDAQGNRVLESTIEQSDRRGDWVVFGQTIEPLALSARNRDRSESDAGKDKDRSAEVTAAAREKEYVQIENRARPRVEGGITLLPDLKFTIPLVLIAASLWLAWRVVNFPVFADFLIATEAEINKVSWSTRKSLVRDTLVVLTSLVLLTCFLFVVDLFWGWFLSREIVNVLPTASETQQREEAKPITEW